MKSIHQWCISSARRLIFIGYHMCVLFLVVLCFLLTGCKKDPDVAADEMAEKAAENYLFGPNRGDVLGLQGATIFGREKLQLLTGTGYPTDAKPVVVRAADGVRLLTFTFWCSGWGPNGQWEKSKRIVLVRMVKAGAADMTSFVPESANMLKREELSGSYQFFIWFVYSSIAPFFLWLASFANSGSISDLSEKVKWSTAVSRYGSTPLSAYLAYVCFGTWLAVAIFAAVHIALTILYLRIVTSVILAIRE